VTKRATTLRGDRATTLHGSSLPRGDHDAGIDARACSPSTDFNLQRAAERWLADGKAQGWSRRTLGDRRLNLEKLAWWLENEEGASSTLSALAPARIRSFLVYVREPRPEGRWGSSAPSARREARPSTVQTFYKNVKAFVNSCLAEGLLGENPLRNIKAPRVPNEQIQPLTVMQLQALLDGARRSRAAVRDVALILFLIDTGMRVSELCGLTIGNVDRASGELVVLGKGHKRRRVYMGSAARRALWRYLETGRRDALSDEPLFVAFGGYHPGAGLSVSGAFQLVQKAGIAAGITGVGPHDLRAGMRSFSQGGGSEAFG
jgi:integrase/recombinase XerD